MQRSCFFECECVVFAVTHEARLNEWQERKEIKEKKSSHSGTASLAHTICALCLSPALFVSSSARCTSVLSFSHQTHRALSLSACLLFSVSISLSLQVPFVFSLPFWPLCLLSFSLWFCCQLHRPCLFRSESGVPLFFYHYDLFILSAVSDLSFSCYSLLSPCRYSLRQYHLIFSPSTYQPWSCRPHSTRLARHADRTLCAPSALLTRKTPAQHSVC